MHGGRQLALFDAHHDSRCFLPMHIYEATSGKPAAVILRSGKTPDGAEVALVLRHVGRAIRRRWPRVGIVSRGDSHYARPEAMAFLERNRVGYVFGLAGNRVLFDRIADLAEDTAVRRAEKDAARVHRFHDFRYAARRWQEKERRVIARIEATRQGNDRRFVVTNLTGTARWLYEVLYCGRGQAENLIKAHKLHLASDRTSCSKAPANQFRLLVHTADYWLLHTRNGLAPKTSFRRDAQFDTSRLAFIKIAARVTEMVTRIKVPLPSSYPHKQSLVRFCQPRPGTVTLISRAVCPRPRAFSSTGYTDVENRKRVSSATLKHDQQRTQMTPGE